MSAPMSPCRRARAPAFAPVRFCLALFRSSRTGAARAWACLWLGAACAALPAHAREPVFTPPQERPVPARHQPWPANSFLVLAYHDVDDEVADQRYLAVTTRKLVAEFAWLREHGYQPVSVQQIIDAHEGRAPLPPQAVLLSFDDGFRSFYTRAYPLLKAYQWPAMLAPVGAWVGAPEDQPSIDFGGLATPREKFATWQQIREMHASGLVEIAAHTHNLHHGHLANPQGNTQPAAASLRYHADTQRYETPAAFEQRIGQDVQAITQGITAATGTAPRAWVWPYGAMHGKTWSIAQAHGYQLSFSLDMGLAHASDLDNIPRYLVSNDQDLEAFARSIAEIQTVRPRRVAHLDLDYIYDPDPAQQERNVGAVVQRMLDMRVNTVFLQAFADPQGDGLVRSVYFPNRVLPMRADLFNRVAWQLRTRATVDVYAWMPVLALDLDGRHARVARDGHGAASSRPGPQEAMAGDYHRLSPFDPAARQAIRTLYEDLAWHARFSGVLFHDDALLREDEDVSAPARRAYAAAGFGAPFPTPDASDAERARWTRFKTRTLNDFTIELMQAVRAIHGADVKSARNLYVNTLLEPDSERWFAQNFADSLALYDWTVPMVMPLMEDVPAQDIEAWLDRVVDAAARLPGGLEKTIFEVQAVDWRQAGAARQLPSGRITAWLRRLNVRGAKHMAYYPDDFAQDQPPLRALRQHLSDHWFPAP